MTSPRPADDGAGVIVVGGGVAGLTVALDLAAAGHRVTVLEAAPAVGGTVARAVVGGLAVDVGAESFAVATGAVQRLIGDLGIDGDVVSPRSAPAWVRHRTGTAPLPAGGWLGIPSRPFAADVRRVIGWTGAVRTVADRVLPAGRSRTLGALVATRLGCRVLDRLVEPVVGGVYSTPPGELPIDRLPARARDVLAAQRSLQAAAGEIRGGTAAPGAQVAGLSGGMYRLVEALVDGIEAAGGTVRTGVSVDGLHSDADGWRVSSRDESWSAPAVVLAGSGALSCRLLDQPTPVAVPGEVLLCTLVVRSGALDAAPRGSGVLVASGVADVAAKALTHATAKWQWLADAAGPGRHVIRLSYGRIGDGGLPDDRAFPRLALADAASLLGVPLTTDQLSGYRLDRWPVTGPAVISEVPELPTGIAVTGGWLAGTGLAAVITHARAVSAELTSHLGLPSHAAGQAQR